MCLYGYKLLMKILLYSVQMFFIVEAEVDSIYSMSILSCS